MNSIIATFANITNFQNFKNAEKLVSDSGKLEIWESDLAEKTLTLPIYLAVNVKESDYVKSWEEVETTAPEHTKRVDDLQDEITETVCLCPSDEELENSE
jgi:hypothetical protein